MAVYLLVSVLYFKPRSLCLCAASPEQKHVQADAKKAYDDLVDSMTEELTRFNTEREADYKTMMLSFAETSRE